MSRIGKKPIPVPQGVDIQINGSNVLVTGPKGKLEKELHRDMMIKLEEGNLHRQKISFIMVKNAGILESASR